MSIRNNVSVNTYYTRSVNLERDVDSVDVISSYIPTSRAIRTLERITETFSREAGPKAWSLIGPYGSGKSSFSLFLSQLLTENSDAGEEARRILRKDNRSLATKFSKEVSNSEGYLKVLITGSPEPLTRRLIKGFHEAALKFWEARRGPNNIIVNELAKASKKKTLKVSEVIELLQHLQSELERAKGGSCKGILLVVDELGKFLEYEARHYGANDIYLLQALAEHAFKDHSINFLLFVLLHQSFEQYAKGLGENLKTEWTKVQGRFEDIPFIESAEQVLRVVSAAFVHKFSSAESKKLNKSVKSIVKVLRAEKAIPATLTEPEAVGLFQGCYPLHPVSALVLPMLCQKVAQNERTLFSYLGSHEEFGLQHLIDELEKVGDWIYPHHIYDYFIANQPAVLGDHLTHRCWVEVITAIERLEDGCNKDENLLKTIGVLNIIGSKGGFKASNPLLELCAPTKKEIKDSLTVLNKQSVITYRRFNSEYRVWQGSDFDLEDALDVELGKLGNFNLADELNSKLYMLPVVARKYTIKNGALRYFTPYFVDSDQIANLNKESKEPRLLFYLANGQEDVSLISKGYELEKLSLDIIAVCTNGAQLYEATVEVKGLENVEVNCQELNSDPVAKREFQDRLTAARLQQENLLKDLIRNPASSSWFWKSDELSINSRRDLQEKMSDILNRAYAKAPVFHNELINRDNPSAQAVAGRNRLLFAMLEHQNEIDLGIDKFPPEKAMYRALLKINGLHIKDKKVGLKLVAPDKKSTVYPVWKRIVKFLEATEKNAKSFAELSEELKKPPYGIKEGVLPILYTAVILVYDSELALYEKRKYIPYLDQELLERFVKRPEEFTVQYFKIEGVKLSLLDQYSHALFGENKLKEERTILDFAKSLAKFIGGLEHYTRKTKSSDLSDISRAFRDAFESAKSPEELLFIDLPIALGYDPNKIDDTDKALVGLAEKVIDCLRELQTCFGKLLTNQRVLLCNAFNEDEKLPLEELHHRLSGRYKGLDQYTVDIEGAKAFLQRLTKTKIDSEVWFKDILAFLAQKPIDKWIDVDRANAEVRLSDFSKRILDLEAIRLHYGRNSNKYGEDFDVILLKSLKKGAEPIDEVVAIDAKKHEAIQAVKDDMMLLLMQHKDTNLQLAALAEFVDDFLTKYRENIEAKPKRGRPKKVINE